jgi:hypothetical protein
MREKRSFRGIASSTNFATIEPATVAPQHCQTYDMFWCWDASIVVGGVAVAA